MCNFVIINFLFITVIYFVWLFKVHVFYKHKIVIVKLLLTLRRRTMFAWLFNATSYFIVIRLLINIMTSDKLSNSFTPGHNTFFMFNTEVIQTLSSIPLPFIIKFNTIIPFDHAKGW